MRLYAKLSTMRPPGMGTARIPVDKIWDWCDRKGVHPEVAEYVEFVITSVDIEILELHEAKQKLERARSKKAPPPDDDEAPRARGRRRR